MTSTQIQKIFVLFIVGTYIASEIDAKPFTEGCYKLKDQCGYPRGCYCKGYLDYGLKASGWFYYSESKNRCLPKAELGNCNAFPRKQLCIDKCVNSKKPDS
ncbi:uncharacterized protein LOC142558103 [Dermacentor variabilis]|uniref:uncharacterized protein LOC142558103 n=1 Tax=Dermacentor variabilis TaxID=34621 RepID=UPI003F5BF118